MKHKRHSKHPVSYAGERITDADHKDAQTKPYTYKQRLYSQKQSCSNGRGNTLKYQQFKTFHSESGNLFLAGKNSKGDTGHYRRTRINR